MAERLTLVGFVNALAENLGIKTFSVLLAVILYMFVTVESDALAEVEYPVELRLDSDEMVVGTYPNMIRATLTGPFAPFLTYRSTDVDPIVVDLRGVSVGEVRHRIDFGDIVPPAGLAVLGLDPQEFEVTVDKRISRELPVVDNVTDRPPNGFKISEVRLNPSKVEVEGPESVVEALTFVRTRPIEVATAMETIEQEVELQAPRAPARLKARKVTATVVIAEEFVSRTLQVTVSAITPDGIEAVVQPQVHRIEFRGPMRFVNELQDGDIRAFVDVKAEVEAGERLIKKSIELEPETLPERTSPTKLPPEVQVRVRRVTGSRPKPAP